MNRRELVGFLAGIPAFAALSDEIALANELSYANADAEDPGQVGTRLLYENEKVKVWDFTLEPGEATTMHTHQMDYLFHIYAGGTLEVVYPKEAQAEPRQIELKTGEVRFVKKGGRHLARNAGKTRYVEVLVELKS
jgi:beta-alanine degradation protein BauB